MNDFTIVIATAVRPSLNNLLNSINNSVLLPRNVIISIPSFKTYSITTEYKFDIDIISESCGQVAQRNAGFKKVSTRFCIQMDDDLEFDKNFLLLFIESYLKLPQASALSPIHYSPQGSPMSPLVTPKPLLASLIYFILDGKFSPRYGSITKSGLPIGINPYYDEHTQQQIVPTAWLPGACVIHKTSNLIYWEYPFQGKAYAEDLMHSQFLKEYGISLFTDRSLFVTLSENDSSLYLKLSDYWKAHWLNFRAISSIPDLKVSSIRYSLFLIVYMLGKVINYCNSKFRELII